MNLIFSDKDEFVVSFQLNVSPYGRLFDDSGSTICRKHLHLFCWWFEWLEAKFQKNLERFSLLPSMFEHLVLRKKTRNTAEHVIHEKKKSLFTHGRAYIKILLIAAY